MDAVVWVPLRLEMSKHSMRSGTVSRPSACWRPSSASARRWRRDSAPQALLVEGEAGVALGQLQDAALVAPLRRPDLHRLAPALGEGLPQGLGAGHLALDDDLPGDRHRAPVVLEDEGLGDLLEALLGLVVEVEALAVREHAVADLEDVGVGGRTLDRDRDGVERADRSRWPPAGARAASGPPAAGCDAARPARTPARRRPPASSPRGRARSAGSGRRGSRPTPSIPSRYCSRVT